MVQLKAQVEPIPGYKLLAPLGKGGFGEVWKVEAPGGLMKALKLINGSLHCSHGGEVLVQQELQSLERVKQVRHPYVLAIDRFDIVDGQLLIVMELADQSVWDQFTKYVKAGRTGIPRDEALRYMEEAAEALDVMNFRYGLQHSDIKPQNLFLVHNHVKVADFGLVKGLKDAKMVTSGCFSPLYAAPETFEGRISPQSDQYSLAIVYQELLTGVRPFDGKNPRQLLMQHMQGEPNVAPLPLAEQKVVQKALAKKPEERFATCGELVQALRTGDRQPAAAPTHTRMKRPSLPPGAPNSAAPPTGIHIGIQQAISIACPGCGYRGQAPKAFLGKTVKCRQCGRAFSVTASQTASPSAPATSTSDTVDEVIHTVRVEPATVTVECAVCGHTAQIPAESKGRFRCGKCFCVHQG